MISDDLLTTQAPSSALSQPVKDTQKVTPDGQKVGSRIDGVNLKALVTHPDERGTLTELYRESWGIHPDPLVYVKLITIRPGQIKGWVKHLHQDDRIAPVFGTAQIVLYDDRQDSPTLGMVNEFHIGEHNRAILVIPNGVYHALRNVDSKDLVLINMPNNLYNHEDPDKLRLPLDNTLIPYVWR